MLDQLCAEGRGLVLVTGPAGSGTTTTLAALVDHVNSSRSCHIVTIEHPIEHLHPDKQAIVSQREVGTDTTSVARRRAPAPPARAPTSLAVGVLPDPDGDAGRCSTPPRAAPSCSPSSPRCRHPRRSCASSRRSPRRSAAGCPATLAPVLRGVLGQRLLERADGKGRVGAFEVLLGTSKVADCVAEDRLGDLRRLVADGEYNGMQTLDLACSSSPRTASSSVRDAVAAADDPEELRLALGEAEVSPCGALLCAAETHARVAAPRAQRPVPS